MISTASIEISLPSNKKGVVIAVVTCPTTTADVLYPLGETTTLEARRLPNDALCVLVAYAATPAGDQILATGYLPEDEPPPPGTYFTIFQDKKGFIELDKESTLDDFRARLEQSLRDAHPDHDIHIFERPTWVGTHAGCHKSLAALCYRVHANARFPPFASYNMPLGERSARLLTVEDVKRRRLHGDSSTTTMGLLSAAAPPSFRFAGFRARPQAVGRP